MIRSTEELYKRFYATALQTIADARDLDKFDFDGQRGLARKTAEMCLAIVKENANKQVAETKRNEKENRKRNAI